MANERHGENIVDQRARPATGGPPTRSTEASRSDEDSSGDSHLRKAGDTPVAETGAAPSKPEGATTGATDRVEIASDESFPASDPPSWVARPSQKKATRG